MIKPIKYTLKRGVPDKKLLTNGFTKFHASYVLTKPLFMNEGIPEVSLNLVVSTDNSNRKDLTVSVVRRNGEFYSPFYNPEFERQGNFTYTVVVKTYNKYMGELLKQGIVERTEKIVKDKRLPIKVKYLNANISPLEFVGGKSDWIDLRVAETVELKKGDFRIIPLGVAMQLPRGYEAIVVPRSSTFKTWGVIQTNGIGVIDETYCGDEDEWKFPAYATRDTVIEENSRICQFRIQRHQPQLNFVEADHLSSKSRGGFGSTGVS